MNFRSTLWPVTLRRDLTREPKQAKRDRLRLIYGSYPREIPVGSLNIVAAPKGRRPFPVDGIVFEEDTFLVMSADPVVRDPKESLVRIMTKVIETRPEKPGSVLVRGKRPLRLLAIVHDLNQEPSWREEWIARALDLILGVAESRGLESIALPFLGTLHGKLGKERFLVLLRAAIRRNPPAHLKRLWLIVPEGTDPTILDILTSKSKQ